jgi:hypothetical protein
MRRGIETAALALVVLFSGLAHGQPAPGKDEKPGNAPGDKPAKTLEQMSLEELLTQALKNNPDLRVADAKVREAEAELNRVRLQVTQKVVTARNAIKSQEAKVAAAANTLRRVQQNADKGLTSKEEVQTAELLLAGEKAKLSELEAELPYLIGKSAQEAGRDPDVDAHVAAGLRWLASQQERKTPSGADAEKLRKALEKPISVQFKKSKLQDVLSFLNDGHGITFLDSTNLDTLSKRLVTLDGKAATPPEITLTLKDTPFGATVQALQDVTPGLRFTVRDYGILVTYYGDLPSDALSVHDFLKSDGGKEKPKQEVGKPEESTHNFPAGKVEGKVKSVEAGLVLIDIGSDAGLEKGQNLEVFRLDPQARYLGTLRILEVRPKEAVGQPVRKLNDAIKEGDRVSNQVFLK